MISFAGDAGLARTSGGKPGKKLFGHGVLFEISFSLQSLRRLTL
jgi:hypothetical protein